ncbi:DUF4983 domain-containing protein [Pedobacter sp. LMG 31464]|uniref:DUF4983 domain-containing protein n=1 Tax=Pedobacter planticolens TaxID=2679964 RepID=A0A923DXX7_9SPHI|nr:DUF4983 domain-containing protein [Pedobacter planticolens]MBB2144498.1 DUF4983 domain-containing protein [Pedobacter planticolens]
MKTLNRKQQLIVINSLGFMSLLLVLLFISSCNKDFPNTLREGYPNDTTNLKEGKRKVLYIILDGVRGNAVKTLSPPNITQIVRKSIYTFDGLLDPKSTAVNNGNGWANSLTGVTSAKHKVLTDDFANNQLTAFPTLFTRLKQQSPNLRTVSIAATNAFNTNLAVDATAKVDAQNSDVKVKDAVVEELKRDDAGIVVAQFHSADEAGAANGYTDSSVPYTTAITQIDTYIGNIITALQARAGFSKEDWLVVIASNKGGYITPAPGDSDLGAFGEGAKNTFTIFYNPKFTQQFVPKPDVNTIPFSGFAPRLVSTATTRNVLAADNNTTIGNFGTTGDYTLIFKVRADHASVGGYPPIIGKELNFQQNSPGWVIFTNGSDWNFKANGTQQMGGAPAGATRTFRDGLWHTIAVKIYTENGSRYVKGFQDGKLAGGPLTSGNGTYTANMSSTTPFTVGNIPTSESTVGAVNVLIREVAMYNVAMPDATITSYMRKTEVLPTDPNYANLMGYWPLTEGSGLTGADKSGKAPNLKFSPSENWTSFLDSSPNLSPPVSDAAYAVVINNVDIPMQIYQWMGVAPPATWNLDGKIWKLLYTDVRNN